MLVLIPLLGPPTPAKPAQKSNDAAIVIVNLKNPTKNLSQKALKKLLSLQTKHWSNKAKVRLVLPKTGSKAQRVLLKKVFKMNIKKLKKYWAKMLYTNKISSKPKSAGAIKSIKMVLKKSGGIAVIMRKALPKGIKVRILTIDGKSPGQKGYPLQ
jgi:ABC-type phosphate transport system substrate-binding protein